MAHEVWRLLGGFNLVENLAMQREEEEHRRQELQDELDLDKRSEEEPQDAEQTEPS
jgi:hypothetical protein